MCHMHNIITAIKTATDAMLKNKMILSLMSK